MRNILKLFLKPAVLLLQRISPRFRILNTFRYRLGKFPNIIYPKTFNEHITRKMIFDRNPQLTLFADKYLVRNYVTEKYGPDILTQLYGVTNNPDDISIMALPDQFVMKPNHLSGAIKIVKDFKKESAAELKELCRTWLKKNYYDFENEWAYKNIKPFIVFEELLEVNHEVPDDYKIFCFNGEPKYLIVDKRRFTNHQRNIYDLSFSLLPVRIIYENFPENLSAPPNFPTMLEIARKLSAGTDFVRVDLYNIEGRIVFGELTNYPDTGLNVFIPDTWDETFGRCWRSGALSQE
jgi:hypothetical protein